MRILVLTTTFFFPSLSFQSVQNAVEELPANLDTAMVCSRQPPVALLYLTALGAAKMASVLQAVARQG